MGFGGGLRSRTRARAALVACAAAACLGATATAQADTTRYVETVAHGGDDDGGANTCANSIAPCLTVQHAVNKASSGDTVEIGPGRFPEAITINSKALTLAGAGPGTATSFDASSETFIDASGTTADGLSSGNHSVTVQNLRIRGGVSTSKVIDPAINANGGTAVPTLTVSNCVVLQASDATAIGSAEALGGFSVSAGTGLNITVENSVIVAPSEGIGIKQPSGALSITASTVAVPGATLSGGIVPVAVSSQNPMTLTGDTIDGDMGVDAHGPATTVTGTRIAASSMGIALSDFGNAPRLTVRDSVIAPQSGHLQEGVLIKAPGSPSAEVPSVDLTFDSVLARAAGAAYALDAGSSAPGTRITVHNTALEAVDISGGTAADEIDAGPGLSWDVSHTSYQHVLGSGPPAPGTSDNFNATPGFVDDTGGDLHLAATSPLFDVGDPSAVQAGETDLDGHFRALAHVCGASALPDVGAYEAPAPSCPGQAVGPPPPSPPPVPSLGKIKLTHKTFRTGGKLARLSSDSKSKSKSKSKSTKHKPKPPVGTTFSVTLNTAATLKLAFSHRIGGRKVKGRCVAQSRHNKRDRACKRTLTDGTLTLKGHAGTDKLAFQGKIDRNHRLKPGGYTLSIVASSAAGRSPPRTATFTIAHS